MSQTLVISEKSVDKLEEVVLDKKSNLLITKSGKPVKVLKYMEPVFCDFGNDDNLDAEIKKEVKELLGWYQNKDLSERKGEIVAKYADNRISWEEGNLLTNQLKPKDPLEFFNAYYASKPHITRRSYGSCRDDSGMPTQWVVMVWPMLIEKK